MNKRAFFVILLALVAILPAHAVLKERNIESTLSMLRKELTSAHLELERQTGFVNGQQQSVQKRLIEVFNQSQENALMLYSQKASNTFTLTYACHEATDQYLMFQMQAKPFAQFIKEADIEINRYDSLINDLSQMYAPMLSAKAKTDRNVCLTYAINIRHTLSENRTQMQQYIDIYRRTDKRLKYLNDYALRRYNDIQKSIFRSSSDNYFLVLTHLPQQIRKTNEGIHETYATSNKVSSDWDARVIIGLMISIFLVFGLAILLNQVLVRFLFFRLLESGKLQKVYSKVFQKDGNITWAESFQGKRTSIILTSTVITFAILIGVLRASSDQNFITMACNLLIEFVWLVGVILLSMLIRINAKEIRNGFKIYSPLIVMTFIVIAFRIVMIPDDAINLFFPPILLLCTIWQWWLNSRLRKRVPKSDSFYAILTWAVLLASTVIAWSGRAMLSIVMLIWWTMQLTCILTITCIKGLLDDRGNARGYFAADATITKVWFFRLIYHALLPVLSILSIIISVWWAADVFNLSETLMQLLRVKLIDTKNFTFSIVLVVQVANLFVIFKYIDHTAVDFLKHNLWVHEQNKAKEENRKADKSVVTSRVAMWRNVIEVLVWGAFLLLSMNIFNISSSWIVAISAGLSTGIGFAMKDILENLYYGISLMAGRIRVGDYISIDGTRGTVKSISYTSTMIEALDGSIITFTNSQLITKNYKNLTKNHGNELAIIPVGVAYGSNAKQVKEIIAEATKSVDRKNYSRYLNVIFTGFGDNSIDFKILAWVDSRKQVYAESDIMEAVYNALNANDIEIPFPQRDIHIISTGDATPTLPADQQVDHAGSVDEAMEKISKPSH